MNSAHKMVLHFAFFLLYVPMSNTAEILREVSDFTGSRTFKGLNSLLFYSAIRTLIVEKGTTALNIIVNDVFRAKCTLIAILHCRHPVKFLAPGLKTIVAAVFLGKSIHLSPFTV